MKGFILSDVKKPEARLIKANAKVIVDDTESKLVVSILPNISPLQRSMLIGWLVLWVILGVATVLYYPNAPEQERTLLIVYLAFWLYFLYTSARGLIWNLVGAEFLKVENGELMYKRSWKDYGRAIVYDGGTIKQLGVLNLDDKSFGKSYGEAFWTIGGEKLGFEYIGRKVAFGMKLTEQDASKLSKLLAKKLRNAGS